MSVSMNAKLWLLHVQSVHTILQECNAKIKTNYRQWNSSIRSVLDNKQIKKVWNYVKFCSDELSVTIKSQFDWHPTSLVLYHFLCKMVKRVVFLSANCHSCKLWWLVCGAPWTQLVYTIHVVWIWDTHCLVNNIASLVFAICTEHPQFK